MVYTVCLDTWTVRDRVAGRPLLSSLVAYEGLLGGLLRVSGFWESPVEAAPSIPRERERERASSCGLAASLNAQYRGPIFP